MIAQQATEWLRESAINYLNLEVKEKTFDKDDKIAECDDSKEIVHSELPQFHASQDIMSEEETKNYAEKKNDESRSFIKIKNENEDSEFEYSKKEDLENPGYWKFDGKSLDKILR